MRRLSYLFPAFPVLHQTFVLGEVLGLQRRGYELVLISLKRSHAAELLRICHAHDARLVINDDVWLAIEIGADGVHLGRDDADPVMARQALGPNRLLGVSCYDDIERAAAAEAPRSRSGGGLRGRKW